MTPLAVTFLRLVSTRIDGSWLAPTVGFLDERMEQDGGHDFGHLWRVLANARRIYDSERAAAPHADISWDAIAAAVLLHDVVNMPKNHPERHLASARSAQLAAEFLASCPGFAARDVERSAEAIRVHSFSAGLVAESAEARIVTDADRLESIGAFAIARTFYVSGAMGRAITDLEDPFAQRRDLDDRAFGVDHFYTKLLRLKERLYTPTARALAQARHALMESFLAGLRDELP